MYFSLLDKIEELVPGKHIVATKSLSMAEEYLRDHFPNFPVMPGVLMLEALTQASAWLVRVSGDFSHSIVLLKEAKGVRYGRFVRPGQTLRIEASMISRENHLVTVKAEGSLEGKITLKAQLILECSHIADCFPQRSYSDEKLIETLKRELSLLWADYRRGDFE
ncbi:MAG: beta-hydroxyacyl-ACP dehydratase [Planctomycetaceae bacterium]|jgi:3-hydroxyacyl-[acyl-carrier-protein] dehydratase|nr:beta-hydroxyacyl-ACP dehydratase [Planctomycetaceae bacterium]